LIWESKLNKMTNQLRFVVLNTVHCISFNNYLFRSAFA
jgi:hypothetical protein